MKVSLCFWNKQWKTVEFDLKKCTGKVNAKLKDIKTCSGWAYKSIFRWYAVINIKGQLYFIYGNRTIPISYKYSCSFRIHRFHSVFKIRSNDEILLSKIILNPFMSLVDITYDELDYDFDSFFYWLYKVWNDEKWQRNLISSWKSVDPS